MKNKISFDNTTHYIRNINEIIEYYFSFKCIRLFTNPYSNSNKLIKYKNEK